MILEAWYKIAYIVQLLAACLIFLLPVRKKKGFWIRSGGAAFGAIVLTYILNEFFSVDTVNMLSLAYWGYYIIVCFLAVYVVLGGSWKQAAYCAACAIATQHIAFDLYLSFKILGGDSYIIYLLIYMVIYISFYFLFARNLLDNGTFTFNMNTLFPIITIISLVWILSIVEDSTITIFAAGAGHRVIYRIIDALCCAYVLWVQVSQKKNIRLQHDLDEVYSIWRQQKKQYEITSETIESINCKCHDLKHQIQALRHMTDKREMEEFLNELESDIMIYDTALNTGNKALDIVLMEKGLFCNNHNIQWSCLADGHKLDFMKNEDIYAIFGNAFDNAITAVMDLEEPEKRVIGAKMIRQNQMFTIQIQNYFSKQLKFEDDLPKTTKKNKNIHGFGMKSIRHTAEKYNGTITIKVVEDIFMLQIFIPIPSER